ncbi:hypothetical protein CHH28_16340 [Bacterioplanes sanyensis]|uniref:SHOCT domain-containing protein n=1 Tax=Bacterioplanes sanyensis TaxID=1249553 RepID=A0A222FNL0_9GAMM|nr:PH domain-containing protein [Bacterioplanes sanyensis]ASP40146.1 hypothetical protein CHH28_16340 [Bacterioplanes sanyensis]
MAAITTSIVFILYSMVMVVTVIGIPFWALHLFMLFRGAKRLEADKAKFLQTLTSGEQALCTVHEKRPFALFHRRSVLIITESRVLLFKRPLFGGYKMTDIQWKDLRDAHVEQNIIPVFSGSHIHFSHRMGAPLDINVDSDAAVEVYRYAQAQEQGWEEKHRVRDMEQHRAMSGATHMEVNVGAGADNGEDILAKLSEAKALLDQGAINDVEFETLKAKLLNA